MPLVDNIHQILIKSDVQSFSRYYFDLSYEELSKIIYPTPKYQTFHIKKKNGTDRVIHSPSYKVKQLQYIVIEKILKETIVPRPSVHGFVKDRSIVSNAKLHVGKRHVFNVDLKDFFPSINFHRVKGLFRGKPFNFANNIAVCLAQICCYKTKLPQGAPTSPILSNIICRGLDRELQVLAKNSHATYTRYCDDITFSFTKPNSSKIPRHIVQVDSNVASAGEKLNDIVVAHGFEINCEKTRMYDWKRRMEVTGLTVNKFPNVKRKNIDRIRMILHSWEKFGYKKAQENYIEFTKIEKSDFRGKCFLSYTRGYLNFIKSVKGMNDPVYRKLAKKFNTLIDFEFDGKRKDLPIGSVVKIREELDKAIFLIQCENAAGQCQQGTAFFLKDVGFVTCDHVRWLNEENIPTDEYIGYFFEREIKILNSEEQEVCKVRIKKYDARKDFLILEPTEQVIVNMALLPQVNIPQQGDPLILCGYPSPFIHRQTLTIINTTLITNYNTFGADHIEISTQIRKGNSGGPVLNSSFEVVGIAKTGSEQHGGKDSVLCIREIFN
ncbi:reverse transcriptase domain-containing protein [Chromobacterium violaceum]|uniref:reverse transcriptase domain-containing protein n=1 Tax=Chromobacterium violaceum TaxID=536 RepID=UPI00194F8C7D|nr:reverse transcriptase domain-containing protein [Chromobacterium violaceum]QRO31787.1 trypsin-like peptidase domain-containing protein [Chromobacterium violaceum]QRQ18413.1 trypsin-like peptidase domain-containing protein [Chromobacterium violaceum]